MIREQEQILYDKALAGFANAKTTSDLENALDGYRIWDKYVNSAQQQIMQENNIEFMPDINVREGDALDRMKAKRIKWLEAVGEYI